MRPPLLTPRSAFHRGWCRWRGHRPTSAYVVTTYTTGDRGDVRTVTAPCEVCSRCNTYIEEPDVQANPRWVLGTDLVFTSPETVQPRLCGPYLR